MREGATSKTRVREVLNAATGLMGLALDALWCCVRRGLASYLGQWGAKSTRAFSLLTGLLRGPASKSAGGPRVDQNCLSTGTHTFNPAREQAIFSVRARLMQEVFDCAVVATRMRAIPFAIDGVVLSGDTSLLALMNKASVRELQRWLQQLSPAAQVLQRIVEQRDPAAQVFEMQGQLVFKNHVTGVNLAYLIQGAPRVEVGGRMVSLFNQTHVALPQGYKAYRHGAVFGFEVPADVPREQSFSSAAHAFRDARAQGEKQGTEVRPGSRGALYGATSASFSTGRAGL